MKFKNLGRYRTGGSGNKLKLSVPIPRTPDGRIYRYSPESTAYPRHFVLGEVKAAIEPTDAMRARMKLVPRSQQTVCPYSGLIADDQEFMHPDDRKAAMETVRHAALADAHEEISCMLQGLSRSSSRNSHVKIEVKSTRFDRPRPRFGRRDLLRELICDHCGRDYGVFAIGLFCPDCGAPNLRLHFAREVELVGKQVALTDGASVDNEELAYRLLGNAHEDVLTAFEATLKTVYLYGVRRRNPNEPLPKVGNDFQNIDRSTVRYADLEINPFDGLTDDELATLHLNIQKRHIIGHNLGVVDDRFAAHASDAKIGETVHLVGEDIRSFAAIAHNVVDRLDDWLVGTPSPDIHKIQPSKRRAQPPIGRDADDLMTMDLDLSPLARRVAVWVACQCPDGMEGFVDLEKMTKEFSENTDVELADAIAELAADGFVKTTDVMGSRLPHFRPQLELYLTFDASALGTAPTDDIATLAEIALELGDSVAVGELFSRAGWERRRFNPAVAAVAAEVGEGRVSREMGQNEFPVRAFFLIAEDRVALRRLVARLKGDERT